jgi:HSP20 family protein
MEDTMNLGAVIPWRDKSQVPANREDFYDPFVTFRREVDRMFDDFFSGVGARATQHWGGGFGVVPTVDVTDAEKEMVVTAELPGLDEKDFEVTLSGDVLTIKGEKKEETENRNGGAYYVERRFGSFSRSVRLPFTVEDGQIDAKYDKGVLTVRVPKPAEAQRPVRRIEVKAS